jgi:hypothetical protein
MGVTTFLLLAALVQDTRTIEKTFTGVRSIEVENIKGPINVVATSSNDVKLVAKETLGADTRERLDELKKKIKLEFTQDGASAHAIVDSPCQCRNRWGEEDNWRENEIRYEFELQVPRGAYVYLKTVSGDIHVEGVEGGYRVRNVNGSIDMKEVAGSGEAYTVNGKVDVTLKRNPEKDTRFGSLNGSVDVYFQPKLNADFRLKTFNGSIFSDFEMTSLPNTPGTTERRNGKFVYKSTKGSMARVGQGGPVITMDGFNGTMHIRSR